jgi:hypothetical protein
MRWTGKSGDSIRSAFHLRSLVLHTGCSVLVLAHRPPVPVVADGRRGGGPVRDPPASHEAVYWMAARFDLMATFFTLARSVVPV